MWIDLTSRPVAFVASKVWVPSPDLPPRCDVFPGVVSASGAVHLGTFVLVARACVRRARWHGRTTLDGVPFGR